MKRVALTTKVSTVWAQMAHATYLDALMSESSLTCEQIAFHGGTSLHLSWRSQRFSEDLDFLISRQVENLNVLSKKIEAVMRERFFAEDPNFFVEIKDKTKHPDKMPMFHIVVSHPDYVGNVMVKAEFWKVDADYLKKYPTEFRTPIPAGDIVSRVSNPVPAAKLETAYCDKLTAFATRPYLKWRDIYDLWWIGTQTDANLDMEEVISQFEHNVSAYQTINNLSPGDALGVFLENDRNAIIKSADPDLKRWLPEKLWERLNPDGVAQMVDYVFYALESVSNSIRDKKSHANLKRVRR